MYEIKVGLATCGISAGGQEIYDELEKEITSRKLDAILKKTGCNGMCYDEVLVEIKNGASSCLYTHVTKDKIERIIQEHLLGNHPVEEWIVATGETTGDNPFLDKQERIVLRNCGTIDPESIEEYVENQGYQAIQQCLKEMTPEKVIETVMESGLKGRGGAGFLTGLKWKLTRKEQNDRKFIVCNADEGDPGAFMDRSVLEGDPHAVLEGMMIAGYAIGAKESYIDVRAEYTLAIKKLQTAIQ